jgi:3-hydroxyacyl-CoA dehydrogenase
MPQINHVTVLGAGVLGTQIAYQTAYHGFPVAVYDISTGALGASRARMTDLSELYQQDGVPGAAQGKAAEALTRLSFTTDLADAAAEADLVIEAAPEVLDIKRQLYADLAKVAPEETIFATNTSALLPSDLKESTGRPQRFLALHYANRIWKQNTTEIMGTADTDPGVYAAVVTFAEATGMVPIHLRKEHAGYISNSLLVPFLYAAGKLWVTGVADAETIDTQWRIGSGSPRGPFQILDVIGLSTAYIIASGAEDPTVREFAAAMKAQYIDHGKLGVMTGEGFYTY